VIWYIGNNVSEESAACIFRRWKIIIMEAFSDVITCSFVEVYKYFGGTFCLQEWARSCEVLSDTIGSLRH
jgi:hypothetical protein